VESLKRKLLDEGMDPHTDVDAERQVWLLEHDVDLEKISGTPQNERMIKNFQKRGKGMPTYKSQRYIISCQVADLKARGVDPMVHFGEREVMEKTRAIYKMDDKVADKVAAQYESLMEQHGGRLTPSQGETPFVYSEDGESAGAVAVAAGSGAKEEKAAARAAAKEKRAAEKEAAREARAAAKAEQAEARARAKADKAAAAEAQKAEKAAATAAAVAAATAAAASSAASLASTVVSPITDGDVAATANGDVFAAAGNNAVAKSSVETTLPTSKSSSKSSAAGSKSNDVLSAVKSYATPKNVATVVIGGAAINYGLNYYKENSAGAQAEREAQLRLILGNDDKDEDEDEEDEFDDDDDEDGE